MVTSTVVLVSQARRMYFFGDEWAFLLSRDISGDGLLRPHNEHWSTLPVLVYRTLFHTVGIDHHLAYAAGPVVLHLASCLLLFRLLRGNDVAAWPSVIAVLTLSFLSGNLGENPLWAFQIGFLGSAAFGLVALVVHSGRGDTSTGVVLAWVASVLSMMCSGMAIPMLLWLGGYVLVARGLPRALMATVPPALVYALWFLTYGRHTTAQTASASANDVLAFTWTGLGGIWQQVLRLPDTGGVVLLGLLGVAMFAPLSPRTRALALSGLIAVAATYLSIGISRAGLGPGLSTNSRYAYFGLLFTAPAFAAALSMLGDRLAGRPRERLVAGTVLTVLLCANGAAQLQTYADDRLALSPGLKGRILATEQLIEDDQRFLSAAVSLPYNPDVTLDALSRAEVREALPDDPVSPRDLINASVVLQVAGDATTLGLPPAMGFGRQHVAGAVAATGCSSLEAGRGAHLDLAPTSTGSQIQLTSRASSYSVVLRSGDLTSAPVVLDAEPGSATFIGSTASESTLRIDLPAGPVEVCLA
jgi:hypothetical protein